MKKHLPTLVALVFSWSASLSAAPQIVGWVENVRIRPGNMLFMAKLDTGALSSSINARNIREFEKNGETWLRFEVINRAGNSMILELPQVRDVTIKEHGGSTQQRPVVMLGICLGETYRETQVSLVDRRDFLYPLLIGRRFLRQGFAVNPRAKFTTEARCDGPAPGTQ